MSNLRNSTAPPVVDWAELPIKAWIVCFAASLFFFYEFIQMNMFNAIDQDLMRAFNIDAKQLTQLSTMYCLANVVFLFPAGLLLDRYPTKNIILLSMGICVTGTFLFALSSNYWFAMVCRFLTGIGSAFCFLSSVRLASRWFPPQRMALITGLIVTMAMLGGMLAQTPLTLLSSLVDWRHALILDSSLGVFIIGIIFKYVEDYPEGAKSAAEKYHHIEQIGYVRSLKMAYLNVQNVLAAVYTSLMNMPMALFGSFAGGLYLVQAQHLTRIEASYVTSMIFIGTIIGSPFLGALSDRIGLRKAPMIIGAVLSLATILIILNLPQMTLLQLMIAFFFLGLFTSSQVLSYPTVVENNPTAITATATSVVSIITQSGSTIYQPFFGFLIQMGWSHSYVDDIAHYSIVNYHHALMIIPIGFLIALIAALKIKETYCEKRVP